MYYKDFIVIISISNEKNHFPFRKFRECVILDKMPIEKGGFMKDPIKDPISGKNKIEIDVCGVPLKILTTEDASYIEEIAQYFESIFKGQFEKKPSQGIDLSQRLALAGVVISDELFKLRRELAVKEAGFNQEIEKYKMDLKGEKQKADEAERKFITAQNEFERDNREKSNLKRELESTQKAFSALQKEFNEYIENFK